MSDKKSGLKSYELRPSKDMRAAGRAADSALAEELLKLIAIGVAGGIATIAGAKKLGESLQEMQAEAVRKAEEQRERYKEAVRQVVANEIETEYETDDSDLTLRPSPLEEQPAAVDLVLESSVSAPKAVLSFDGQEEAEKRIADAMTEYDAAMDEAADLD